MEDNHTLRKLKVCADLQEFERPELPGMTQPASDQLPGNSSGVKCGGKPTNFLRKNTSLKELELSVPLQDDEVHDILYSLEDNHTLVTLACH